MVSSWVVGAAACALLSGGCYFDLVAGVQRAGGGVRGNGWHIGMTGGLGFDFGAPIRPSVGFSGAMRRFKVQDGDFGTTGLGYHGRVDVAISHEHIKPEDMSSQAGVGIPAGGADASTRIVLDYGWGKYEDLSFKVPDQNPEMIYERRYTTHNLYLGIGREYDVSSVQASFSIGPSVLMMPNDFVGDTTAIGVEFHSSFWFLPIFKPRPGGSMLDAFLRSSDPVPEKPLPSTQPTEEPCYNRRNDVECQ